MEKEDRCDGFSFRFIGMSTVNITLIINKIQYERMVQILQIKTQIQNRILIFIKNDGVK
jgi:hypothetical protein